MTIQTRIRNSKQVDLAAMLNKSQSFLSDIARNKKSPSITTLVVLGDSLGVSDEEFRASCREWANIHAANDNAASIHAKSPACESTEAVQ